MNRGKICFFGASDELLSSMKEHVWSVPVSANEIAAYTRNYKVANVKTMPDGAWLRILSTEKPNSNAIEEAPVLEDVFLHYFGEKKGEEYASI